MKRSLLVEYTDGSINESTWDCKDRGFKVAHSANHSASRFGRVG
jgi:hypothetical protein